MEPPPYCLISVTAEREVVLPAAGGEHDPWRSVCVAEDSAIGEVALADHEQHVLHVVEDLDCCGRVVDRGRERPVRDVDHHADGERGILLDRALLPERDHALQIAQRVRGR